MQKLNKQSILYERMKRQGLMNPIESKNEEEYVNLFRRLQPVAPVHFTRPGDPPSLVHRTYFNDYYLSSTMREQHKIVKGRFLGGRVAYVLKEDLELFAIAFRTNLTKVKPIHEEIMNVIRTSGGISKEQLKEELDYPSGEITKTLKTLQEAFLVFEEQTDTDWDTGWFDFSTEWFEVKSDQDEFYAAVSSIVLHFLEAMVFATVDHIKSWSQLSSRVLNQVIKTLLNKGEIVQAEMVGVGEGYIRKEDAIEYDYQAETKSVVMLDKSDFLVRADLTELQKKYKGHEVLQYLLIDGEFKGAVLGHWRIGPYDIDDVSLELEEQEAKSRKEEIIEAIRKFYSPETTSILKYNGVNFRK